MAFEYRSHALINVVLSELQLFVSGCCFWVWWFELVWFQPRRLDRPSPIELRFNWFYYVVVALHLG